MGVQCNLEHALKVFQTAELLMAEVEALTEGMSDQEIRADEERLHRHLALITAKLPQVQTIAGETLAARATLQKAVRQQPSNPQTWLTLGRFDLADRGRQFGILNRRSSRRQTDGRTIRRVIRVGFGMSVLLPGVGNVVVSST